MTNLNMNYPINGHYTNRELVTQIQDCEAHCEHMTHHLKMHHHHDATRSRQSILLRECADMCTLTAKYASRGFIYAKHAANLCAQICWTCGQECSNFPDQMSNHCAQMCFHCARECMAFANM